MFHAIRTLSLALGILQASAPPATAQTPRPGDRGGAGFTLENSSSDHVTLNIVNQGITSAVQPRSRGIARSLPFLFPSGDSTAFYRIRVANAATGNTLCEGVVQMKWTRTGSRVECLVSDMPTRCQMPPAFQHGYTCGFIINHW